MRLGLLGQEQLLLPTGSSAHSPSSFPASLQQRSWERCFLTTALSTTGRRKPLAVSGVSLSESLSGSPASWGWSVVQELPSRYSKDSTETGLQNPEYRECLSFSFCSSQQFRHCSAFAWC